MAELRIAILGTKVSLMSGGLKALSELYRRLALMGVGEVYAKRIYKSEKTVFDGVEIFRLWTV